MLSIQIEDGSVRLLDDMEKQTILHYSLKKQRTNCAKRKEKRKKERQIAK